MEFWNGKFDKVQEILDKKSKVNNDGSIDLLFGILKCKVCGNNMIKRTSKGKVYYYANYYRKRVVKTINQYQKVY